MEAGPVALNMAHYVHPQALNAVERYDGHTDAHAWIESFGELAALCEWSNDVCLRIAKIRLKGPAQRWAQRRQFNNWADFAEQFLKRFGETKQSAIIRLEQSYQRPNESIKNFADRYMEIAERAGRDIEGDDSLLYQFVQRLQPDLRTEVARQRLHNIDEVVAFCNYWTGFSSAPVDEVSRPAMWRQDSVTEGPAKFTPPPPREFGNKPGMGVFSYRPAPARAFRREVRGPPRFEVNRRPASNAVSPTEVDDLARKLERLEINLAQQAQHYTQQLHERDREIQRLHHAVGNDNQPAHLALFSPVNEYDDLPYSPSDYYEDEMMPAMKRAADEELDSYNHRMPHKRTAIEPRVNTPYAPASNSRMVKAPAPPVQGQSAPAAAIGPPPGLDFAGRRLPRQRAPIPTPSRAVPSAPRPVGVAPGPLRPGPSVPIRSYTAAASLAEEKGKEVAAVATKVIKFDGSKEASIVPQAVLHCAAGHMIGDTRLVEKGKIIATEVDALVKRIAPISRDTADINTMAPSDLYTTPRRHGMLPVDEMLNGAGCGLKHPAKVSTCKVLANVAGHEVEVVVDTGASSSAITLDCLRKLGLDQLISTHSRSNYINADGRLTSGKGRVFGVPVGLGNYKSTMNPTVTHALNYSVLLGNDVLVSARAVIDYDRRKLILHIDPETVEELDIHLDPSPNFPLASLNIIDDTQEALAMHQSRVWDWLLSQEDSMPSERDTGEISPTNIARNCTLFLPGIKKPPQVADLDEFQYIVADYQANSEQLSTSYAASDLQGENILTLDGTDPTETPSGTVEVHPRESPTVSPAADPPPAQRQPLAPIIEEPDSAEDTESGKENSFVSDTMREIIDNFVEMLMQEKENPLAPDPIPGEAVCELPSLIPLIVPSPPRTWSHPPTPREWSFLDVYAHLPKQVRYDIMQRALDARANGIPCTPLLVNDLHKSINLGSAGLMPAWKFNHWAREFDFCCRVTAAAISTIRPGFHRHLDTSHIVYNNDLTHVLAACSCAFSEPDPKAHEAIRGAERYALAEEQRDQWWRLGFADWENLPGYELMCKFGALFSPNNAPPVATLDPTDAQLCGPAYRYPARDLNHLTLEDLIEPPPIYPPEAVVQVYPTEAAPCVRWGWEANWIALDDWRHHRKTLNNIRFQNTPWSSDDFVYSEEATTSVDELCMLHTLQPTPDALPLPDPSATSMAPSMSSSLSSDMRPDTDIECTPKVRSTTTTDEEMDYVTSGTSTSMPDFTRSSDSYASQPHQVLCDGAGLQWASNPTSTLASMPSEWSDPFKVSDLVHASLHSLEGLAHVDSWYAFMTSIAESQGYPNLKAWFQAFAEHNELEEFNMMPSEISSSPPPLLDPASSFDATCLRPALPPHPDDDCEFPDDDALDDKQLDFGELINKDILSQEEYAAVATFLCENVDVFALTPEQLGCCTITTHTIDTGDAKPVRQTFFRMPFKKYEQMQEHVETLLRLGIIRNSNSDWASPAHLVPKRIPGQTEPGTRLVIDYRRVNQLTKPDRYPMPLIREIIYNIGTAAYISTMDTMQGYLQVELDAASAARSAFITPFGLFEYTRMPFGLANAPATFSRIIMQVIQPFINKFAFAYLDDIIVYSPTFEQHLDHLAQVFEALRSAGLRLSPRKCHFFQAEVSFLGFIIDRQGIRPDPRLLTAIEARQPPRNAKDTASFLGLTGYFRMFVKNYAKISEPLTKVIGIKRQFEWGAAQQKAFDTLKRRLISYPVLRRPDYGKPFRVYCDASTKCIAGILTQRDTDGEYVCAYHSRQLTPSQQNWTVSEQECYAVVDTVCRAWADILLGADFTVVTDHVALKWLMTAKGLVGKLCRWSLRLQAFMPFDIEYRAGRLQRAVDCLSRPPGSDPAEPDSTEDPTGDKETSEPSIERPTAAEHVPTLQTFEEIYIEQDVGPNPSPDQLTRWPLLSLHPVRTPRTTDHQQSPSSPSRQSELNAAVHRQGFQAIPFVPWATSQDASSTAVRPVRIYLDGSIGSGKSTIMAALMGSLPLTQWTLLPEPVEQWQGLLQPFYEATPAEVRECVATLLQIAVLNAYVQIVPTKEVAPRIIMERGPWSSLAVFLQAQSLPSQLRQLVYDIARSMRTALSNALPSAIIYLHVSPEVCLARIQSRARHGETDITLSYLQLLQHHYMAALSSFPGPVRVIDAMRPIPVVITEVLAAIKALENTETLPYNYALPGRQGSDDLAIPPAPRTTSTFATNGLLQHPHIGQILTMDDQESCSPDPESQIPPGCEMPLLQFYYEPTPLEHLYRSSLEVPVFFQLGPGRFSFSYKFHEEYERRFGVPVNYKDRVGNQQMLEVFLSMAPWEANGWKANIQLAFVPSLAKDAIRVKRINENGSETVYIDTQYYVLLRLSQMDHASVRRCCMSGNLWLEALLKEGYMLDSAIRITRIRPSCFSSVPSSVTAYAGAPMHPPPWGLNLASGTLSAAPHANRAISTPPDAINILQEEPSIRSATPPQALARKKKQYKAPKAKGNKPADSGPSVDINLPCTLCQDPSSWSQMLLCSNPDCTKGYHTFCLGLDSIPKGDWYCPDCQAPEQQAASQLDDPVAEAGSASEVSDAVGGETSGSEAQEGEQPTAFKDIWQDQHTIGYLKTQEFDADMLHTLSPIEARKEMKRVIQRSRRYRWDSGTNHLYKRPTTRYQHEREVVPPHDRLDLITSLHIDHGHLGQGKIIKLITQRYFWVGVSEQVKSILRACDACIRSRVLFKIQPEMRPLPTVQLFERVHVDTAGPYPKTRHGNCYLYLAVDSCSKWVMARAFPKCDSETMCYFISQDIIACHGCPRALHTDNGKEFAGSVPDLCVSMGIELNKITPYNAKANGAVEIVVRAMLHGLQRSVDAHPETWDEYVPMLVLGMCSAVHCSTGYSPFFLVTGRQPVLPAERRRLAQAAAAAPDPNSSPAQSHQEPAGSAQQQQQQQQQPVINLVSSSPAEPTQPVDELLDEGTRRLIQTRKDQAPTVQIKREENVKRAQERQKRDFKKRHHSTQPADVMPVGSLVYMKCPASTKMSKNKSIEGPYRLVAYDEQQTRCLLKDAFGKTWPVYVARVTPYATKT